MGLNVKPIKVYQQDALKASFLLNKKGYCPSLSQISNNTEKTIHSNFVTKDSGLFFPFWGTSIIEEPINTMISRGHSNTVALMMKSQETKLMKPLKETRSAFSVDKIWCSHLKNLPAKYRAERYTIKEENFDEVWPKEWIHSSFKPTPKPGKEHHKLNGYQEPDIFTTNTFQCY